MKKIVKSFHFWLLVAVVAPFVTVSLANIAGLDWVIFKDELDFTGEALLILLFFTQVIITTRTFGFKGGLISCFALGTLICLQVINSPRSQDYFFGVAGIVGIGICTSLLIDRQEKEKKLLNERAEERKHQAAKLSRELTERKQAEEALIISEERYRTLVDNANEAIVVAQDGMTKFVNPRATEISSYSQEDMTSMPFTDLIHPDDRDIVVERHLKRLRGEEVPQVYTFRIVDKESNIKWVEINAVLITWEGRPATLNFLTDVTELKKTQEQLQHSQVLASLGEMTAGIAHEVNNPLGSILLYSELLMNNDVPAKVKKDLRVIHNEARRTTRIMTDLLTYGRRIQPHMRRSDLHKILRGILEMRRYQQKVQNINVTTNLTHGPLYIKGDSSQLTQVFLNLILNTEEALRKSNGSHITVTTQVDEEWAKVSIADDGTGIPEEHLSQVFYPFFSTKKVGKGIGLGLSTCYGIVTAHGGLIHAENNEMGGATFTVELPLAEARGQGRLPRERKKTSVAVT